ncbi:uncharacterized protein LOC112495278 [Cephus cinctus]|uniref:Uncharacterized protein LOC112495278 n=1 Tax=Cephus cinctus TaxID=211228 RepID=A0AAJ7W715_CEPCN|nr:uncharacterized protein LOC112495278 [Cephus cinctus]
MCLRKDQSDLRILSVFDILENIGQRYNNLLRQNLCKSLSTMLRSCSRFLEDLARHFSETDLAVGSSSTRQSNLGNIIKGSSNFGNDKGSRSSLGGSKDNHAFEWLSKWTTDGIRDLSKKVERVITSLEDRLRR